VSWSTAFRAALRSGSMSYQVRVENSFVALSSAPGRIPGRGYITGAPTVTGQSLSLRSWKVSGGEMLVPIQVPRAEVAAFRGEWEIGDRCSVRASVGSTGVSERIWFGRLLDVSVAPDGSGVVRILDAVALTTAVQSAGWGTASLFTDAGETSPAMWFAAIAVNSSMSSNYQRATKGYVDNPTLTFNPTTSGQNLALNSVSGYVLGYSFISGADEGAVMVQGAGAQQSVPYLLTYTGISSPNLTGTKLPGTVKITPPHYALSPSDPVRHVSWVDGHAFDIIRAVLQSSPAGTNGAFDVLPSNWGVAFDSADIEQGDIAQWYGLLSEPATPRYTLAVMEQMEDGMRPVWDWAAELGVWPVLRQGMLSLRAAADPNDPGIAGLVAMQITDDHILEYGAQMNRHPDSTHVVRNVLVAHSSVTTTTASSVDGSSNSISTSTSSGTPYGWPRSYSTTLDLVKQIFHDVDDQRKDAGRRLAPWWQRFAGAAEVVLTGEALQMVAGDPVEVTSKVLTGPDGMTLNRTRGMWIPTGQDWGGRQVPGIVVFLRQ